MKTPNGPKKKLPQAICDLAKDYTHSSYVEQPLNGHIIELYLVGGCSNRQCARDIIHKFKTDASEKPILGRLNTLFTDLTTKTKNFKRNELAIRAILNIPFDLSANKTPQRAPKRSLFPLTSSQENVAPPPLKTLKTDCAKCPTLRHEISELGNQLINTKKTGRQEVRSLNHQVKTMK